MESQDMCICIYMCECIYIDTCMYTLNPASLMTLDV